MGDAEVRAEARQDSKPSSPRKRGSSDFQRNGAKTLDSRLRGNDEQKQVRASAQSGEGDIQSRAFADLYEMSSGISSTPAQAGHGAPFLSFSTVFNSYFLPEILPDSMDTSESEQKTYSIKAGDIFLTRTSETVDELAMSSVALKDYPHATFSGFLKRLRPTAEGQTDPKFMAFYLRSPLFRKTMTNNAVMVLRASLNEQIFSYLKLLLPDFDTQTCIGEFLHLLYAKIDLNNRINAELEALAKTIYDYWFVQFDFPDAHGRPYKSSGGAMVWNDTLKREIPVGWDAAPLEALVEVVKKGVGPESFDTTTPYVGLEHIARKCITLSDWSTADKATSQKVAFRSGDILFGKIRPYFHKVALTSFDGIASTDAIVMRPRTPDVAGLALETIFADEFVAAATASSTGSKMPRADWSVMRKYGVAVPGDGSDTVAKYQNVFHPLAEKIASHVRQNRELARLRDWLLPLLMNGQVRVA